MAVEVEQIIQLIEQIGGIEGVNPDDDFYEAGFSSINALNLLLELETLAEISIPDDQFVEVRTPQNMKRLLSDLTLDASS